MNKNQVKLSPKQREVIAEMREGRELKRGVYRAEPTISLKGGFTVKVKYSVIKCLLEKKLIDITSVGQSIVYTLTELGKSINL